MKKFVKLVMMMVMLVASVCIATGCDYEESIVINKKGEISEYRFIQWITSGEMKMVLTSYGYPEEEINVLTDDELDAIMTDAENYAGMKVGTDGLTYFGINETDDMIEANTMLSTGMNTNISNCEFEMWEKTTEEVEQEQNVDASDYINYDTESMTDAVNSAMGYYINVTMPEKIVMTTGELSKDGKSVTFSVDFVSTAEYDDSIDYAYTAKSDKIITLTGSVDGKYTSAKKLKVTCPVEIKSIKVNGEEQTAKTVSVKEDGTYTIDVETEFVNKTFTVIRDTVKPTVKGVKNKKVYNKAVTIKFSDDASGIMSATLNGEEISNKKKVKANGDYTLVVTDNAGNVKKVKFTIGK